MRSSRKKTVRPYAPLLESPSEITYKLCSIGGRRNRRIYGCTQHPFKGKVCTHRWCPFVVSEIPPFLLVISHPHLNGRGTPGDG